MNSTGIAATTGSNVKFHVNIQKDSAILLRIVTLIAKDNMIEDTAVSIA